MAQGGAKPLVPLVLPALALGASAAAGVADSTIRSDGTIVAFDATVPVTQAFGDAAAVGAVAFAARRDHRHGMPTIALSNLPAVPACRAYHTANQSIADSTQTALALNSERWDTDTIHDPVTNNSRLTCKTAGKYLITGHAQFDVNATGLRALYLVLNGVTSIASQQQMGVTTPGRGTFLSVATIYDLAVNDYVQLHVRQESTAALNIVVDGNDSPEVTLTRIGA